MSPRPGPKRSHNYDAIFRWIVAYKRAHDGNSPSMREIASACHIPSLSQVEYILAALEGQGRIVTHSDRRTRSICVVGGQWSYRP